MTAEVHSDTGYFALVPEWLLDADVTGNAIKLYAILARYADQATKYAHPSRRTLAERMGFSRVASVDPLLQQLVDAGALKIFERFDDAGDRTSNGYIVNRIRADRPDGVVRETAPPHTPDRTGGGTRNRTTGGTRNRTTVVRETAQEPEPLEPEPSEPEVITAPSTTHVAPVGSPQADDPDPAHPDSRADRRTALAAAKIGRATHPAQLSKVWDPDPVRTAIATTTGRIPTGDDVITIAGLILDAGRSSAKTNLTGYLIQSVRDDPFRWQQLLDQRGDAIEVRA